MFTQWMLNDGPVPHTVGQHLANIGSKSCVSSPHNSLSHSGVKGDQQTLSILNLPLVQAICDEI